MKMFTQEANYGKFQIKFSHNNAKASFQNLDFLFLAKLNISCRVLNFNNIVITLYIKALPE